MGFYAQTFGGLCVLLLIFDYSHQNVHIGVDLVTKLSNNWIPMLVKEVSKHSENVVVSPYGLMSNLAMVLEAANEKTREEFYQALNISSGDIANLRKGFKAYCSLFLKYSNDPEAAGSFNSASLTSTFKLNSTYKDVLEKFYCANTSEVTEGTPNTLELSSITGVMSHWKDYEKLSVYTFLSHRPMVPFKKRDGSTTEVPLIPQVGVMKAGRWENSSIFLVPLQAKLVNLLIIMPDQIERVDTVAKKLVEFTIPYLVQSLEKREMELFIPQTTVVNKSFNMTSMLIRNGIRQIFDSAKANLNKASPLNKNNVIYLTKMEQNAFFSTSFVSVNSVSGISSFLGVNKRSKRGVKSFYVNQPFLFFILQKDTQLVLLGGKVENPSLIPI